MGIFFQPDMSTSVEVPAVEAVLLLQRQISAASQMDSNAQAPRELKRGDLDQPRETPLNFPLHLHR